MRTRVPTFLILLSLASTVSATTPPGFQDELVASVAAPTALAFTPDGRLLITTQSGKLRIYRDNQLLATPALDLAPVLCTNSERGLLGVAVDPQFSTNRFIYLFYTFNKFGACVQNSASSPVNRVSRFTLADTNTVNPSTELILLDNIPSPNGNHNGGDLHVGADGFLYVSVGDGGCDYLGDSGCAGANDAARDQHVLLGKILRITTTGGIPSANPFRGSDSVRCNTTGRANPGQKCQETFAWGLRNPFRIAFDPNASGTRFFINDVGQNRWEEIDEGKAGADYGWNAREGHCVTGSTTSCGAPPAGMVNPIFDYAHADGCASITGGAFVPRGVWPAAYDAAYMFSDYVCGRIFRLTRNADGTYTRTTFASDLGASSAVHLVFGPWQASQALYYTTYATGGEVRRIISSTNRAPVARVTAAPLSGPAPLSVRFDASASSDPDGDALTFEWNFGDGGALASGAVVTHTYSVPGRYSASVTVRDGRSGQAISTVVIDAGNSPPVPTITSPSTSARFSVGQTVTLTGSASDPEEGTLPASRLSWSVILHHDTHTHPFVPATSGNNLTFQAPAPEDLAAASNSYLEIVLSATDSQGATTTVRRDFRPKLVAVTFETVPAGLRLTVNGTAITTPRTITSWDKYQLAISAQAQKDSSGQAWLFSSWSDGGAPSHTIVTPTTATTLAAAFAAATEVAAAADAYVRAGAYATQNFGTATTLVVKQSATADVQRRSYLRFALPAMNVGRAVLRLRGALSSSGDVPVAVHPVASTSWSESALTWNTQPARGTTALATTRITSATSAWYEWDVTAYVRAERAAGRSAVAFGLVGTAATTPYAAFRSRQAASDRPALLLSEDASPPAAGDIVLYSTEATAWSGTWRPVADTTAAGGQRMSNPDAGAAKLTAPLAAPSNFVELSFTPQTGRAYRLWMRGKADRNSYSNDSVYVQFSGSTTSTGAATYRIGSSSATTYVLEDCSGCAIAGWGWQDNGYGVMGPLIYFGVSGPQRMRIQTREDGLSIDQVILSPATYLTQAPGALTNDTTIVTKP